MFFFWSKTIGTAFLFKQISGIKFKKQKKEEKEKSNARRSWNYSEICRNTVTKDSDKSTFLEILRPRSFEWRMCKKNIVAKRCLVFLLLLLHCPDLTGAVLVVIAEWPLPVLGSPWAWVSSAHEHRGLQSCADGPHHTCDDFRTPHSLPVKSWVIHTGAFTPAE